MGAREYTFHVDHPDGSGLVAIGPGDEIPDWARKIVDKRHLPEGESYDDADGDGLPDREAGAEPPRNGKGSSRDAWVVFAGEKGFEIPEGVNTRDEIIAALETAGVIEPVEPQ